MIRDDRRAHDGFRKVESLVSRFGVVRDAFDADGPEGFPDFQLAASDIGSGSAGVGAPRERHIYCHGARLGDAEMARLVAIAEGAERYAAGDFLGEERILASAEELEGRCVDVHRFPRCSNSEYAAADCPLQPFDPRTPIRWVRGLDLVKGEYVWVPAIMASYRLDAITNSERFTYPISTGYAVHTSPSEAAVRGICEVIERDIIALTWLQKLPLPPIDPEIGSENFHALLDWFHRRFMRAQVFDATSDLGVPTAYCVISSNYDPRAARFVGAGTARTLSQAAEKAVMEAVSVGQNFSHNEPPQKLEDIHGHVGETGLFMAVAERSHAFDFLTESAGRPFSRTPDALPADAEAALRWLVSTLESAGMQPVVVDRTPQELRDVGLTALCAVIPDLQPMSLDPRAQFKGHPRLYEAPARMGHRVLPEEDLNPWPQPFA